MRTQEIPPNPPILKGVRGILPTVVNYTRSLPLPVSPVTSTLVSHVAACAKKSMHSCNPGLLPIMPSRFKTTGDLYFLFSVRYSSVLVRRREGIVSQFPYENGEGISHPFIIVYDQDLRHQVAPSLRICYIFLVQHPPDRLCKVFYDQGFYDKGPDLYLLGLFF